MQKPIPDGAIYPEASTPVYKYTLLHGLFHIYSHIFTAPSDLGRYWWQGQGMEFCRADMRADMK